MNKLKEQISLGNISEARKMLEEIIRDDPLSMEHRSTYIEVLCVQGDLERADQQLDIMVRQNPDCLIGAVNMRQLIRAETARRDFFMGAMSATLFHEADSSFETLLSLNMSIREDDIKEANRQAQKLEQLREPVTLEMDEKQVSEIRDLDDSLCGYLELLGTDGKFYLTKFSEIELLELQPVKSVVDLVWRRVDIAIANGPSGEAFLPISYVNSATDSSRMGKDTDWVEHGEFLVTGLGQKMLLINEEAVPLSQLRALHKATLSEEA